MIHVELPNSDLGVIQFLGVIVPMETGVTFHAQVGGVMCQQAQLEGLFIPLPLSLVPRLERRSDPGPVFNAADLPAGAFRYLSKHDQRRFFEEHPDCQFNTEAWELLIVELSEQCKDQDLRDLLGPFKGRTVVLVYGNSD